MNRRNGGKTRDGKKKKKEKEKKKNPIKNTKKE